MAENIKIPLVARRGVYRKGYLEEFLSEKGKHILVRGRHSLRVVLESSTAERSQDYDVNLMEIRH